MKWGFYITAFVVPLSLTFSTPVGTFNTPLEPFLLLLTISTLYRFFLTGIDKKLIVQPLSVLVALFCTLIIASSIFSQQPVVSLRIALLTLVFIFPSYFGMLYMSTKDAYFPVRLLATTLLSFGITCALNFLEHWSYDFHRSYAPFIPEPFYSDHTIYATTAAFLFPLAFMLMIWYSKQSGRIFFYVFLFLFISCFSALLLSYSRGALVSVVIAFLLYIVIKFRIRWYFIAFCIVCALSVALFIQEELKAQIKSNRADSKTHDANIEDQFKSITNVNNDLSNLERINRWNSALRMIEAMPFIGFGHGMYQYEYFPYQKPSEMTYVSIRNPQSHYADGTGGSAHSEYLLLSSENGIATGLIYIGILITGIVLVMRGTKKTDSSQLSNSLLIGLGMSLTTYIVHSFFNNFLDTAQVCFIFFGLLASITSIYVNIHNKPLVLHT
ncbi:MAG: O-antigen ligase family protein [Cytophagales bacterium]|nr:O-antigen ligase family protein [Cytophaga sp.]